MGWLKDKIDSVLFAGLNQTGSKMQASGSHLERSAWGRFKRRVDRWISGGPGPSDPLYLSNRTTGEKMKSLMVVALPLLILIAVLGLVMSRYLAPAAKPMVEPTPAEVAAKFLPNINDIKIEQSHDVEVMEVRIEKGAGVRMSGTVRNKSNHTINSAEITCDLTDSAGTQIGAVVARVENIPPAGTKDFSQPLPHPQAMFVVVREISTK